ncbi:hypothetical protein HN51_018702 [Arachis hypogaea]|nr:uncharacterized protein DS421_8g232340 [Arachis hypogaea]
MEEQSPNSTTEYMMVKLQELRADLENDMMQIPLEEEMVQKFMQDLYKEINTKTTIACSANPTPPVLPQNDIFIPLLNEDQEKNIEHFEADFDDEWLSKVLVWCQIVDNSEWF